jgi:hypothetical protein
MSTKDKDIILKTTEHGDAVGMYSANTKHLVSNRFQVFREDGDAVAVRHDGWPLWLRKDDFEVVDPILKIELSRCAACPHWHWTLFRFNPNDGVWCNTGRCATSEKYEWASEQAGKAYNSYLEEYRS